MVEPAICYQKISLLLLALTGITNFELGKEIKMCIFMFTNGYKIYRKILSKFWVKIWKSGLFDYNIWVYRCSICEYYKDVYYYYIILILLYTIELSLIVLCSHLISFFFKYWNYNNYFILHKFTYLVLKKKKCVIFIYIIIWKNGVYI